MADAEDRTQAPSERRLAKAREDGQAPLSREVTVLATLAAAALVLSLGAPSIAGDFGLRLRQMLVSSQPDVGAALQTAAVTGLVAVGPLLAAVTLAAAGSVLLQTGFLLHGAALMPDLARLDPRRGLRRVFGLNNLVEAAKGLVKLAVLGWATWSVLHTMVPMLLTAAFWTEATLLQHLTRHLTHLVLVVVGCQAGIALLDVAWTRWRFSKRLSMSKEDLKQEHREAEGDPKIKARIKQLRMMRARRRMMAAVAKATVVVTNPTHYAVALVYERGTQSAPRVVAKGVDDVAARIRAAAEKAGVPLVANPPLARALYSVALDAEVPAEHFKVVAEVIAYVWRLRSRGPGAR